MHGLSLGRCCRRNRILGLALSAIIPWSGCSSPANYSDRMMQPSASLHQLDGWHTVHFETDSAALSPQEALRLRRFLQTVRDVPGLSIVATGYADERAGHGYNLSLAAARASTVAAVIRQSGFEGTGVVVRQALGKLAPVSAGHGAAALWANRRVEVDVYGDHVRPPACASLPAEVSTRQSADGQEFLTGCASAWNLARMVADPRDLVEPRTLGAAYAERSGRAVDKYMKNDVPPLKQVVP